MSGFVRGVDRVHIDALVEKELNHRQVVLIGRHNQRWSAPMAPITFASAPLATSKRAVSMDPELEAASRSAVWFCFDFSLTRAPASSNTRTFAISRIANISGSGAETIGGVHICSGCNQNLHRIDAPDTCREHQRRAAAIVRRAGIFPARQAFQFRKVIVPNGWVNVCGRKLSRRRATDEDSKQNENREAVF